MKKFLFLLLCPLSTICQTTLSEGDIAIIRAEATNPDEFSFVVLKDLAASTVINFTDNGFTAVTTGRTGEGFLTYTAPSAISLGTVISWTNGMTIAGTGWSSNNPSNFAFNASGDQLFAFQGSTGNWASQSGISLIFGINYGTALSATSSASNTVQPTNLSTSFISLPTSTANNCYYAKGNTAATSVKKSGTANCIRTDILSTAKWYTQSNASGNATNPTTVSFSGVKLNTVNKSSQSDQCLDAGWSYFGDDDGLYFAMNKNGNTLSPSLDISLSSAAVDSSLSSNGANQEHASYLMKRYWNVNCGGCSPTTNGGVSVRFYYDPADSAAASTAMRNGLNFRKAMNPFTLADTTTSMQWIKNNTSAAYAPTMFTGNKMTVAHIKLTPIYGSQNGVRYVQFDTIKSFSGGGGGFGYGPSSGGGIGLPVTWVDFYGRNTEIGSELYWSTASEKNTSHFELEYSTDGTQFITINQHMPAAGHSSSILEYKQTHLFFAPKIYYRIKQVDLDGLYDYSKTIVLKNKDITNTNFIKVLPSFVQGQEPFTIQGYASQIPFIFYEIINAQGQRILFNKILTLDGYFNHSQSLELYPSGLYYIRISDSELNNLYEGKIRK